MSRRYFPVSQPPMSGLWAWNQALFIRRAGSPARLRDQAASTSSGRHRRGRPQAPLPAARRRRCRDRRRQFSRPRRARRRTPTVSAIGTSGSRRVREVEVDALDTEPLEARVDLPPHPSRSETAILALGHRVERLGRDPEPVRTSACESIRLRTSHCVRRRTASAVSNQVMPASQAASMSSSACSRVSPWPKKAGAEPIPPKLPQPRMKRDSGVGSLHGGDPIGRRGGPCPLLVAA